jgi:hypothetical protein
LPLFVNKGLALNRESFFMLGKKADCTALLPQPGNPHYIVAYITLPTAL